MASTSPFFFIVNPRAGYGGRRFAAVSHRLRADGVPFFGAATLGPGDASVLARMSCGHDLRAIVCVGGDGTINEVVNGLSTPDGGIDPDAAIGVVPSGTAQDFARGMGIPTSRDAAVERLLHGKETRIDVGRIRFRDGRVHFFVNAIGMGFDAEVAGRAQDVRGAMSSIPAHLVGFASVFPGYQNKEIALTFDEGPNQPLRVRSSMVVVANGPSYSGVLRIAPKALPDDGLLDVVVIGDVDKLDLLVNLPRAFTGTHLEHAKVAVYRVPSVTLDSDDGVLVQADGEVVGLLPVHVDVLPQALRLLH
jgi:YegS/Rv2252/BmrU family lipid kinase